MRVRLIVLCTCAAALLAGAVALGSAGTSPSGHPTARGDRYLGPVAGGTLVRLGLSLRMRSDALARYGDGVAGGRLPALTAAQIGERFGLPLATLNRLEATLTAAGIHVDESFRQRTQLLASGSAASVEGLLHLRLGRFLDSRGVPYEKPLGAPVVPAALRAEVVAVTHLNTKQIPMTAAVPQGGMNAAALTTLYNLKPLLAKGLDGAGQTVAVYSADTFLDSDIQKFDSEHGIVGAPPIQRVQIEPGPPVQFYLGDGGAAAGEVDLDTEVIRELAPKAQIINYEAPCCNPSAMADGIDKIVSDGKAKLANFSYEVCENYLDLPQLKAADENSFGSARAANVTAFVSSGDEGAYACQRADRTNHALSVDWPGSSPNVVCVGGTYVDLRADNTRYDETGWEEELARAGGGGGVSAVFPRPTWQTGVAGINNRFTTNPPRRQTPDVSADGAFGSPYGIVTNGGDSQWGGTSAAAPFWTGSFVLIDQLAQRQTGHTLPFIAPLLYAAAAHDPGAFVDITQGGNRYYRAGPGWDNATGLGVPNMARLAADVIAAARGH